MVPNHSTMMPRHVATCPGLTVAAIYHYSSHRPRGAHVQNRIRTQRATAEGEDNCKKQCGAGKTRPNAGTINLHRRSSSPTHRAAKSRPLTWLWPKSKPNQACHNTYKTCVQGGARMHPAMRSRATTRTHQSSHPAHAYGFK